MTTPTTDIVREGVTEPRVYTLQSVSSSGVKTAQDLTGVTRVELHLTPGRAGSSNVEYNTADHAAKLAITDEESGQVTFSPDEDDLLASVGYYECYFRITDAAGKTVDFPSDGRFVIDVLEQN